MPAEQFFLNDRTTCSLGGLWMTLTSPMVHGNLGHLKTSAKQHMPLTRNVWFGKTMWLSNLHKYVEIRFCV